MNKIIKQQIKVIGWKYNGNNYVYNLEDKGCLSYNENTQTSFFDMFMDSAGHEETALTDGEDFWILNGDFRKEYEAVLDKGFDACYKVYLSLKDKYNSQFTTGD